MAQALAAFQTDKSGYPGIKNICGIKKTFLLFCVSVQEMSGCPYMCRSAPIAGSEADVICHPYSSG